jgi:hypothetical protein
LNEAHRIVSSEAEELILVDTDDNEAGFLSKAACHAQCLQAALARILVKQYLQSSTSWGVDAGRD